MKVEQAGSPEPIDSLSKFDRNLRRWEFVLNRKEQNMEQKRTELKQMLHKQWKREKVVDERYREEREGVLFDQEKRAEKMVIVKDRKKVQEVKVEKKKMAELKKSLERQAQVRRNREIIMQERAIVPRSSTAVTVREEQNLAPADNKVEKTGSSTNLIPSPTKSVQRAYSSQGFRQCDLIKKMQEEQELEGINSVMAKCEADVKRATEFRRKAQADKLEANRARSSSQKTVSRLNLVYQQHQSRFEKAFEVDYEHRKKISDARKRIEEEERLIHDDNKERKNEKLMMLRKRQEDNKIKLDKRNNTLDKRWRQIKKKPATFADGNFSFYEPVAQRMELDARKSWIQKWNLQREVRKNQAYKCYLVDKFQTKESHVQMLTARKK